MESVNNTPDDDEGRDDPWFESADVPCELRLLREAAEQLFEQSREAAGVTDGIWTLVRDEKPWVIGSDSAVRVLVENNGTSNTEQRITLEDVIMTPLGTATEQDAEPVCTEALTVLGPILFQIAGNKGFALSLRVVGRPGGAGDEFLMMLLLEHMASLQRLAECGGPPNISRTTRRRTRGLFHRPKRPPSPS